MKKNKGDNKMIKSACSIMKKSIVLTAALIVTGTLLEIAAQFLSLESIAPVVFTYSGVFAISLGLIIFTATLIAIMIPKVNQHLDSCQH